VSFKDDFDLEQLRAELRKMTVWIWVGEAIGAAI
jgi:hypothetical protein